MHDIFALNYDLPPELKHNILRAHHAKISDKAISKYLNLPLSEVKLVIAQDALQRREQVELQQWSALISHNTL
jgi:hypothetical protein